MAKVITTQELKAKTDSGIKDFHLIDVLSPNNYSARHIPGALNVPFSPDFMEHFTEDVGVAKDADIIVYCSSNTCQSSVKAAAALDEAGYTKVSHYKDGLAGWQDAGHEFEGEN